MAVVAAGLATVLAVVWITLMPSLEQFYERCDESQEAVRFFSL